MEYSTKVSACDTSDRQYTIAVDPPGRLTRHETTTIVQKPFGEIIPASKSDEIYGDVCGMHGSVYW